MQTFFASERGGWDAIASSNPFRGDQIFISLAAADDSIRIAVHQDFGDARAVVVVAAHGEAVGAGGENGEQIAARHGGKPARLGQVVARFADRAYDIDGLAADDFKIAAAIGVEV